MLAAPTIEALQPFQIGNKVEVKNRLCFSSMGLDLCDSKGLPKPAFFEFYRSLIEGGCGFGFLCNGSVDLTSRYNSSGLKLTSDEHADALIPLLSFAEENGVLLGPQLQHYGAQASEAPSEAAPSAMPTDMIENVITQFVSAAQRVHRAGAKIVQLQAANGYLLSSFLSPKTNQRIDKWGGNPRKRAAVLVSIIERITAATKGGLMVSVRLGIDDGLGAAGQRPELLVEVIRDLQTAGAVSIECSVGVRETFKVFFQQAEETLKKTRAGCQLLKNEVEIPVGFTGSVTTLAQADEIIRAGDADFIGYARAVLADNHLISKEAAGKFSDVHRCRGDAFCFRDKREPAAARVYCCVNPDYRRPKSIQDIYEGISNDV